MKCFEKLVRTHIVSILPPSFDPHQFANRSTEDAITTALHSALCHLEQQGSYAWLLFVDFSSAFNTILPDRLITKLLDLGYLTPSVCGLRTFCPIARKKVRVGRLSSSCLSLSTGSPQGCVLSPLLYTLYTHDCTPTHSSKPSSSSLMIPPWWGSSLGETSPHTGTRWSSCQCGV